MSYLYLYLITASVLLISLLADREKTFEAVKVGVKRFVQILPAFVTMLILVSAALFLVPESVISAHLGTDNLPLGLVLASFIGSITLMPGFIAFPLCGLLLQKGVSYMVLGAFSTTLMMVGVLTYPIEKEYFGARATLMRNAMSLAIALVTALFIGLFFGEVF